MVRCLVQEHSSGWLAATGIDELTTLATFADSRRCWTGLWILFVRWWHEWFFETASNRTLQVSLPGEAVDDRSDCKVLQITNTHEKFHKCTHWAVSGIVTTSELLLVPHQRSVSICHCLLEDYSAKHSVCLCGYADFITILENTAHRFPAL